MRVEQMIQGLVSHETRKPLQWQQEVVAELVRYPSVDEVRHEHVLIDQLCEEVEQGSRLEVQPDV